MSEIKTETIKVETTWYVASDGKKFLDAANAEKHQSDLEAAAKKAAEWAAYKALHIKESGIAVDPDDFDDLNGSLVWADSAEALNLYAGRHIMSSDGIPEHDLRFPSWFFYRMNDDGNCHPRYPTVTSANLVLAQLRDAVDQLEDIIEPAE